MAKKRKITRKRKMKEDAYVYAIILMIFSILLAVLIYIKSGYIGEHLSPALGGLIGWIKYFVPIGTFAIGISLIKDEKEFVMPKIMQYIVIILCICAFMTALQLSSDKGSLNINDDFSKVVADGYDLGMKNKGGGVAGVLVSVPMIKLLGIVGTNVVLIGVAILLTIFTFGIKPAEIIDRMLNRIEERRQYEEDNDEDEYEQEIKREKKVREKKVKKEKPHSTIIKDPFGDEEVEESRKDISFEEKPTKVIEKENKTDDYIEANLFKETQEEKEEKTKQVLQLEHAQVVENQNYEFPPIILLEQGATKKGARGKTALTDNAVKLEKTLRSFGVSAKVLDASVRTCNYKI